MKELLVLLSLFVSAHSMSGGGLASLALEGNDLHVSLRTPPLDSFRDLPLGVTPQENPQSSGEDVFVRSIARSSSHGRLGPSGIRAALYARYAADKGEVGIYGLEMKSDPEADHREKALREIWAVNGRRDLVRIHRQGLVILVVWRSGVSSECWEAVNAGIVARIRVL